MTGSGPVSGGLGVGCPDVEVEAVFVPPFGITAEQGVHHRRVLGTDRAERLGRPLAGPGVDRRRRTEPEIADGWCCVRHPGKASNPVLPAAAERARSGGDDDGRAVLVGAHATLTRMRSLAN